MTMGPNITPEVKVNGADWWGCRDLFTDAGPEPDGALMLLRELAVLTPLSPPQPLRRETIESTLTGLDTTPNGWHPAGWQGWRAHGGVLNMPMTPDDVAEVEAVTGPLPADYRAFLTEVAASGAGPGYGLLRPEVFDGVIPLAHAGCGVAWVMRLDGDERGTVWVDAAGSDETYARVADSFSGWYRAWLDNAVRRNEPYAQWDARYCAAASGIAQAVESMGKKAKRAGRVSLAGQVGVAAISLRSGNYLPEVSAMDPCHPCVCLVANYDLPPEVFAPGVLSRTGRVTG
jgi:hypothetical protein